jgi:hypothetical protein
VRLDWALLADSAQVRDGLVFILGGGIDTIVAPQLPAQMNASVVVRLLLHRTEAERAHVVELRILDEDGGQLAQLQGQVVTQVPLTHPPAWDIPLTAVFGLHGLAVPRAGLYSAEVLADGAHMRTLNFQVKVATPPATPPLLH